MTKGRVQVGSKLEHPLLLSLERREGVDPPYIPGGGKLNLPRGVCTQIGVIHHSARNMN